MVIAFQIILLIVILISFMVVVGEKEDEGLRKNLSAIIISGMAAFIVSVLYL